LKESREGQTGNFALPLFLLSLPATAPHFTPCNLASSCFQSSINWC